ncbi:diguanylate cyclase (GGDEF) domain-containing protein [Paenibacillus tianmuensis]|uniref:Diguanylate cyclase (GGDEF) domain-containing protein n=1 Tax=Paenibacillus tianmuensis TaxID=624147 RepID=A0A1G4QKK8_9BACL|nr:sensor domain-containing diguanylate cyclase [Paenibacillus tianmuensis]SCW44858.1 diguanylate cyclase (GGDEF) domain-containing protein [Paenibacillus tianmuensis]
MIRFMRPRTVKQRFRLWIALAILMLGLSINIALYILYQQETQAEALRNLSDNLSLQTLFIDRWVQERTLDMRLLTEEDAVRTLNKPLMEEIFRDFTVLQKDFSSLSYVNADGVTEVDTYSATGLQVNERDSYWAAKQGKSSMSDVIIRQASGETVIIFSTPTYDKEGQWSGLLLGSVKLETIQRVVGSLKSGETGDFYLLDWVGVPMTKPRFIDDVRQNPRPISTDITRRAAVQSVSKEAYANYNGDIVFGSYQWIAGHRWLLIGEVSKKELNANLYGLMLVFIAITLVTLMLSFSGIVILTRRIERPLEFLLQGTRIIKEGQYGYHIDPAVFKDAPAELQELCDNYNLMSRKLKTTVKLLEESAMIDPLTELYNRRYMMQNGNHRLLLALEAGYPCSLLLIDIDYFKQVNDSHGHLVGDRVLRHVAGVLQRQTGGDELAARYGGEEFMVLALRLGAVQARALAETICRAVAAEPYEEDGVCIALTVSIGGAACTGLVEGAVARPLLEHMIEEGDKALYRAKQFGRNRVEWETGPREDG